MWFEKYRRLVIENAKKNKNNENGDKNSDNRIHFSDFIALCIATFEVMVPVLIIFFVIFLFCIFLLTKFWLK